MVTVKIKREDKKQQAPAWIFIFLGVCLGVWLVALAWGFYEHQADKRYYDCMYHFAENRCAETGLKDFDPTYSAYRCYPESETGFYVPSLEDMAEYPSFMDNTTIGICWNRSRSLFHQIDG